MSKIQDALGKIQSQRGTETTTINRTFARVSEPTERTSTTLRSRAEGGGGRQLIIDFNALREGGFLATGKGQSRLESEMRIIKRPVLKYAAAEPDIGTNRGNVVLVTSALAGEGKTFTGLNLCLSLAREKDWEVLFVDGDTLKQDATKMFAATHEPGLLDLVRNEAMPLSDAIMPTNIPGFYFMPAGEHDPHSTELFSSSRMDEVVELMSERGGQRLVVFDSSPLLAATESSALSAVAGQVLLVVYAGHTTRQAVSIAISHLDRLKPINAVLNQSEQAYRPEGGYWQYGGYETDSAVSEEGGA